MKQEKLKLGYFWLKGILLTAILSSIIMAFAFQLLESRKKQDIEYIKTRTKLQLNIEQERVSQWISNIENYGLDFIDVEPLRTYVVGLANTETIAKNSEILEDEKGYIQTILDGFLYQYSLKRVSIIAGTGDVFLHTGYNGDLNKGQKQMALKTIAESQTQYKNITNEDGELVLEIFRPIYGFVVDDLPVAVLHMAIILDEEFINLITKDLPIEGGESIIIWQEYEKHLDGDFNNSMLVRESIAYDKDSGSLSLRDQGHLYTLGFEYLKEFKMIYNTVKVKNSPLYITLKVTEDSALKLYQQYYYNIKSVVVMAIITLLFLIFVAFSKLIVKRYKHDIKNQERLEAQSKKTVNALVKTLELRDPYLAGHYFNVKDYALAIAKEMNLSQEDILTLEYSAMLAGIGKIAIPKYILTKPEKLTAEETKVMQSHVNFAEEILEDIDFDLPICKVVSQMYERIDGSGYPRALSGIEINKLSRILAVCDVFCALRSPRSYRDALDSIQALEEMQKDMYLFDAEVLAILFKIIRK